MKQIVMCIICIFILNLVFVIANTSNNVLIATSNKTYKDINTYNDIKEQPNSASNDDIRTVVRKLYNTMIIIVRILAIAAIVVAGVKYMLASANERADIKKQMLMLVIGGAIVFGSTNIINMIVKAASDL